MRKNPAAVLSRNTNICTATLVHTRVQCSVTLKLHVDNRVGVRLPRHGERLKSLA